MKYIVQALEGVVLQVVLVIWATIMSAETMDTASTPEPDNGDNIRLVGGSGPYEGRVEILYEGRWGTLCKKFGNVTQLNRKVCQQLGFGGKSYVTSSDAFGPGTGWKWTDVSFCDGDYDVPCIQYAAGEDEDGTPWLGLGETCAHQFDIGVICDVNTRTSPPIRLVDTFHEDHGYKLRGGLPEVKLGGKWGVICVRRDDSKYNLMYTICRQLGYSTGTLTGESFVSAHNRTIWLDNVQCPIDSARIDQCRFYNGVGFIDDHVPKPKNFMPIPCRNLTLQIECEGSSYLQSNPTPPAPVRLVGGQDPSEGRVEVYHNGEWGSVCVADHQVWGQAEAARVCRQLGYHRYTKEIIEASTKYRFKKYTYTDIGISQPTSADIFEGQADDKIWLDSVQCDPMQYADSFVYGSSYQLSAQPAFALKDCERSDWGGSGVCNHNNDVGVVCGVKYTIPPPIRLVGENSTHAGRLEVFFQKEWGTVCFEDDWDYKNLPETVCNQLGLLENVTARLSRKYGGGDGRIWLQNVTCEGDETRIDSCRHGRWGKPAKCDHSMDIGIICDVKYTIPPPIRLVGGSGTHSGRLEVFFQEEWGTVCFEEDWDYKNLPEIVCNQLGLENGTASLSRKYGGGDGRIWLHNVTCEGDETRIDSCRHNPWREPATCDHSMDIGIICDVSQNAGPSSTAVVAVSTVVPVLILILNVG